ncbi:MAG: nucleoside-diphosphate sugar epimerase/dehydratase [Sulfurovaceae bacterium]|nr:nucleoside-diphosphate sugar epimerase/dehydratase [Sulfurovaceae bacterium]
MGFIDRRILNIVAIIVFTFMSFGLIFWITHKPWSIMWIPVWVIICIRILASFLLFQDYSLSWSKVTQKTFLLKSIIYASAFAVYMPFFYKKIPISFLLSELFVFIFFISLAMYGYYSWRNRSITKTKEVVIYGAGQAGLKIENEFRNSIYRVRYFVDDDKILQKRSIDGIKILSKEKMEKKIGPNKMDLLIIAMPSANKERIKEIYKQLGSNFEAIKILPSLDEILRNKDFATQLKDISVEDLLARHPKDLDKTIIEKFIKGKKVLITGAGGSIGSEIARQCAKFGAAKLILLDHSEFNLYTIAEELHNNNIALVMQSIVNKELLEHTFNIHRPDIVIHAAAYKHVPLVEENISEAILNNVIGTKNTIDMSIKYDVKKFVLISTDKAVRPTNVMGATKRICELYVQNVKRKNTEIVAVRFGNVLGSSGSVIPKFKAQIERGGPITVTHPDITRYFMLIPEACELVLQAASLGHDGEIFILDMGEPIKIVDLAKKMIELSGKKDIKIAFSGLRTGEKLYEELLIDDTEAATPYNSITVAKRTDYPIAKLNLDIQTLLDSDDKLAQLKQIVPEFNHQANKKEIN